MSTRLEELGPGVFHSHDEWYWKRLPDGGVAIYVGKATEPTHILPSLVWCSIIAHLSANKGTTEGYEAAKKFHLEETMSDEEYVPREGIWPRLEVTWEVKDEATSNIYVALIYDGLCFLDEERRGSELNRAQIHWMQWTASAPTWETKLITPDDPYRGAYKFLRLLSEQLKLPLFVRTEGGLLELSFVE